MKALITIIIIIVLGISWWLFSGDKTQNPEAQNPNNIQNTQPTSETTAGEAELDGVNENIQEVGSYLPYSANKLALADEGDVVLFFNATWCPTCRALVKDLEANLSDIPEGVTILSVDYDTYTDLRQKYGVTYQHTFVQVDSEGNQIHKWSSSPTLEALLSEIK